MKIETFNSPEEIPVALFSKMKRMNYKYRGVILYEYMKWDVLPDPSMITAYVMMEDDRLIAHGIARRYENSSCTVMVWVNGRLRGKGYGKKLGTHIIRENLDRTDSFTFYESSRGKKFWVDIMEKNFGRHVSYDII